MERNIIRTLAAGLGISLALGGCTFRDAGELYVIPQPPKDYEALQTRLSEVLSAGGEYAAPLTGEFIQSVQLQDVNGDGQQEAVAFFRFYSDEKPLKIYIFRQNNGSYEMMEIIEGAGTAINSVEYAQLNNDSPRELVVSWQMSDTARSLTAYSLVSGQAEELFRTDYDSYRLADLDQDGQQELAVFRTPVSDPERLVPQLPQAELYDFNGIFELSGTTPLSKNITSVASGGVRSGYLVGGIPALFVVSNYGDTGGATVTDIITYQNGALKNITLVPDPLDPDPNLAESRETIRYYTQITGSDINSDGIMELPSPVPLLGNSTTSTSNFWLIHWRQFDAEGTPHPVFTTYHNDRDGWYFILPDAWGDNITLSRTDQPGGGERAVTISYPAGNAETSPVPMLTIYKLTGANRVRRASLQGRFILFPDGGLEEVSETNTIYAARFERGWDNSLTAEEVRARFEIIRTDWAGGN